MQWVDGARARIRAAAREHLGDELGREFAALLTVGTRLRAVAAGPEAESAGEVVGWLGGPAQLAAGVRWPTWARHGPMAHIATLDCRRLYPRLTPAMQSAGYPSDGLLSFFYFDGQADGGRAVVDDSRGARVVYTPPDVTAVLSEPPAPVTAYRRVELTAEPILTWPNHDGVGADECYDLMKVLDDVHNATPGPLHQIGGHPYPIQGPVEEVLASRAVAPTLLLLAQFDSDEQAGFMWGDSGLLYYMIRPENLAAGDFDRTGFTWQCC